LRFFESGNLDEFIKVVESEALTLHAMMMTSMPYFILMKPTPCKSLMQFGNSEMRLKPSLFTLDAEANVHVLSKTLAKSFAIY
jgi:diphosphomevalonate decarboxylase